MTRAVRWLLLLAVMLTEVAQAQGTIVVIEAVRFKGSEDISKELLASAVDLPAGYSLTREELDQRLERARERLMALGYFRSVDLQLIKGSARDRYELLVTLDAVRSIYGGLSLLKKRGKDEGRWSDEGEVADFEQLFVGSRNLLGAGLRGEVSLLRHESQLVTSDSDLTDSVSTSNHTSLSRYGAIQVSLFDPSIGDTPWFAGVMLGYTGNEMSQSGAYGSGRGKGSSTSGVGVAGRRFGLLSATVSLFRSGGRNWFKYRSNYDGSTDDSSYGWYATLIRLGLQYSDKSFLTTIEPGTVLTIDIGRETAPKYYPATTLATALHTVVFGGDKAITPSLMSEWQYLEHCRQEAGGLEECDDRLQRMWDYSLTYEHVLVNRVVLGITYGELLMRRQDRSEWDEGYPKARWRLAANYNADGLILEGAFLYGDPGLDRSEASYYFPDYARLTK